MELTKKRLLRKWEKLRRNLEIGYGSRSEILSSCYAQIKADLFEAYVREWNGKDRHEIEVHGFLAHCAHEAFQMSRQKEGVYWMEIQDLLIRLDEIKELDKNSKGILI